MTAVTKKKQTVNTGTLVDAVLKPSKDRKTQARPSQKNTYGLLPASGGKHGTCPDATAGPGGCAERKPGRKKMTCYVDPLMTAYPNVYKVLAHNTFLMRNSDGPTQVSLLMKELDRFRRIEYRYDEPQLFYRLHWSGDFFDRQYTESVAEAVRRSPDIMFWGYTRSYKTIPDIMEILDLPNLQMYLSMDPQNAELGLQRLAEHKKVNPNTTWQVAWMGNQDDYENLNHENKPRLSTCPELVGKLPLQGACLTCQKCLGTRRSPVSILFTA